MDPDSGLRVLSVGHITDSFGCTTWRRLDRTIVGYAYRARGWFETAGGPRATVEDGSVLALLPGLPHRYGPEPGSVWDEYYVVCEGPWIDAWRERGWFDRGVWRCGQPSLWRRRLHGFVERCVRKPAHPLVIATAWTALLAELLTQQPDQQDQLWLARACEALDCLHLASAPPLPRVAEDLGEGYESFRKRFLRLTGESPGRYRVRRLLDRIAAALTEGDQSLAELAQRFGFADAFHLSRRFKLAFGRSPSSFRRARSS